MRKAKLEEEGSINGSTGNGEQIQIQRQIRDE